MIVTVPSAQLLSAQDLRLGNELGLISSVATSDVEEQAIHITAWHQEYDQISSGRFSGSLTEIWLGGMQFFIESNSQALRQSCVAWPGSFWFGIPAPTLDKGGFLDEYPFEQGAVLVRPGGKTFELITPQQHDILGLVIEAPLLAQYLETNHCAELYDILARNPVWQVPLPTLLPFWEKLASTLYQARSASTESTFLLSHSACQLMLDGLVMHLIEILQVAHQQMLPKCSVIRHRHLISSVRDYVLSKKDHVITIKDLCDQFHVSRRTLQNCFQDTIAVCPITYLKAIRLNAVRRVLKKSAATVSIQDIACDYGFWHMSQFSADYRRLFGEKPSETRQVYATR